MDDCEYNGRGSWEALKERMEFCGCSIWKSGMVVALSLTVVSANAGSNASLACTEAIGRAFGLDQPQTFVDAVKTACEAAFADKNHRDDRDGACDRQVRKLKSLWWLQAAYACRTAMSIAISSSNKD